VKRSAKLTATRTVVLLCFAAALVPRAAVYQHQHDDDLPGHVHAWDGSQLDDVHELLDEVRHGHLHPHVHPSGAATPARNGPAQRAPIARAGEASRGPGFTVPVAPAHTHAQRTLQLVARAPRGAIEHTVVRTAVVAPPSTRPAAGTRPALRARSPPRSSVA
jgi:hypothetical protein